MGDGNLTSTITEVGQDKDPYELISASKMISYKLLSVLVGGSTNDRKFSGFHASLGF